MNERFPIPDQMRPIVASLLRPKADVFEGRYGRWYVRWYDKTPEEHCPSFATERQARDWVRFEEE